MVSRSSKSLRYCLVGHRLRLRSTSTGMTKGILPGFVRDRGTSKDPDRNHSYVARTSITGHGRPSLGR